MREERARRLLFLNPPSFEQRDDSLREELMNITDDEDDDDHHEDDHDVFPSNGSIGMKLTMTTPKDAYRAVTTPMTAAVTPMTPSPIQWLSSDDDHGHYLLESVSPNPKTNPTTAPDPRKNSYQGNSALSELQQGYLGNSNLISPQVQVKCRALFRDDMTPDSSRPLHDVVLQSSEVPSTIRNACRRTSRLSESSPSIMDIPPIMPMATPFGMSERRRSSNSNKRDRVSPTNTSPDNSLHCIPDTNNTSPRSQQRFSKTSLSNNNNLVDTEKRYTTTRPRRNLLAWTLGLVALSSAGTVLMMTWSLLETSSELVMLRPPIRADRRYSDAGLRGKMVQTAGQHKTATKKTKAAEKTSHLTITTTTTKAEKHKKEAHKPYQATHKYKPATIVAPKVVVDRTTSTQTHHVVHMPPKVSMLKRKFDNQDPNMYTRSVNHKRTQTKFTGRVVSLDEQKSFGQTLAHDRRIKQYPADFTDNTQLYSILSSSDERLNGLERREPYSNGECVPMQEWQTTFYPVCNFMHEIGMESTLGTPKNGDDVHLFGTNGYWRNAWRLDLGGGSSKVEDRDTVVLKTLKFQHNFEDAHFEHDRIDAVAMERLTSSPHVINMFGFCGHSVLTEYADGSRVGELADKSKKKPLARLTIARDIANGLADVHGIGGDGNATFVHLDINPANVVSIGGTLKLNDFNIGIIRRWNTTSNTPCGFPAKYPNPQWRSPEEARDEQNLTEKVDIFSMGHIFFRLICGHEPWNKLEPGGKPAKDEIDQKVRKGKLPFIPDFVMNSDDKEVIAIREAMLRCYAVDPLQRPSAREIARTFESTLNSLQDSAVL